MLDSILQEVGLSDLSRKIYATLLERGASSAKQLATMHGMPRPSVYDHLKLLIQKGLVIERIEKHAKVFQADDTRRVSQIFADKISKLQSNKESFENLIPTLIASANLIEPKVKFYPGTDGLKQAFAELLLEQDIETTSMWPIYEMVEVLGEDSFLQLDKKRIKQNIYIRGIWPNHTKINLKTNAFLGQGKKSLREVRQAPKNLKWSMGYWQYKDKVILISSKQEAFALVIQSNEFAQLLKMLFEQVWVTSKSIAKN